MAHKKKKTVKVKLCGETYSILWQQLYGVCIRPGEQTRGEICINYTVPEKEILKTVIHEGLHAVCPKMKHSEVYRLDKELGKLLWAAGYRRVKK